MLGETSPQVLAVRSEKLGGASPTARDEANLGKVREWASVPFRPTRRDPDHGHMLVLPGVFGGRLMLHDVG